MGEFFHIAHRQFGHVFHRFHQQHHALGQLPHRAFHFGVAFVADHNNLIALLVEARHFFMHFGDQRAGSVEHLKTAIRRLLLYRFRYAVRRINQGRAFGDIGQIFDKDSAFSAQIVDHKFIVHHFMTHINRRAELFQRTLYNTNGAIHPGAKTARVGQHNHFFRHWVSSRITRLFLLEWISDRLLIICGLHRLMAEAVDQHQHHAHADKAVGNIKGRVKPVLPVKQQKINHMAMQ